MVSRELIGKIGRMYNFSGEYSLTMDSKGRVSVPAKERDSLARLVVAKNPLLDDDEKCLWIYPYDEWVKAQAEVSALPNTPNFRKLRRVFLGGADERVVDSHGRVLIKPELRQFAELNKKAVLVGQGNKLELWSEAAWNELMEEAPDASYTDEIANLSL